MTFDDIVARLRAAGCVFAEDEAALLVDAAGGIPLDLEQLVARRAAGEPLEQVLGWVEFAGRRWDVAPGVFVPRQRTELMVHTALRTALGLDPGGGTRQHARAYPAPGIVTVVDLCCGCGAIGGAVAAGLLGAGADVVLHASDVDPAATACAARNLRPFGAAVQTGDLFAPLPEVLRGDVDLLLCNAPYVPSAAIATMPPEARDHEPLTALDGGADGLDVLRRVIAEAPAWLRGDDDAGAAGSLLFEVGEPQVGTATALVEAASMKARVVRDDETGGIVVVATPR